MLCSLAQSRPTLCDPADCSPPGSSVHGISPARIVEWVVISRGFPQVSPIAGRFFTVLATREAQEYSKCKSLRVRLLATPWAMWPGQNTGVGSLSLLRGIFPTQGWNTGLPHHRRILYQLSHEGSPRLLEWVAYAFSWGPS